ITRRRGIAANSSGKRSATSASSNANSTSSAGSVTTSRPEGSGSSSWSHSLSKARTFSSAPLRLFAPPPHGWGGVLGRFGLRLVRRCGFERVLKHVFHPAGEVERHRFAHALRHVVDVLLVALGEDDLGQAHAVCGEDLLLDA